MLVGEEPRLPRWLPVEEEPRLPRCCGGCGSGRRGAAEEMLPVSEELRLPVCGERR